MKTDKAPFPYFGSKKHAASVIWEALGDVPHYVEPFCGSLAVLLGRPHQANRAYFSETVNDIDCLLTNAWRAIRLSPDATAEAASYPVSELDLAARHIALVKWREECRERLAGDPAWHDPVMAGWWMWGLSCWIGGGWCDGTGPWTSQEGLLVKQAKQRKGRAEGVNGRRPHLGCEGLGLNAPQMRESGVRQQLPHLGCEGLGLNAPQMRESSVGEPHEMTMPALLRWFRLLSARLRHVRIICGDWRRAVTTGAALILPIRQGHGPAGVFLDPPYASSSGREGRLYAHDSMSVAHEVAEWAIKTGSNPKWRIIVASFEGEHGTQFADAGWREVEWFTKGFMRGGMGNMRKRTEEDDEDEPTHQQHRERLWMSPHCVQPQKDLFSNTPTQGE